MARLLYISPYHASKFAVEAITKAAAKEYAAQNIRVNAIAPGLVDTAMTDKIAGLGICASSGYMADAAAQSEDIKSIALVAPWLHNAELVNETYGGEEAVQALIQTSREAEAKYAATGEISTVPAASTNNENAVMYEAPYYTESDRGAIPEYGNEFNLASWEGWLTYDAVSIADNLQDPVLIVHSETAAIPTGAKEFYNRLPGEKEQMWLENVTQFDFYDSPEAIAMSSEAVDKHFEQTL